MNASLLCYSLEEILAEKLRTPLQALRRASEGRWLRNCARDYYDLWFLTWASPIALDADAVGSILREKCAAREVTYRDVEDFFPPLVVTETERQWRSSLGDLVRSLPSFGSAITELKPRVRPILKSLHESSSG